MLNKCNFKLAYRGKFIVGLTGAVYGSTELIIHILLLCGVDEYIVNYLYIPLMFIFALFGLWVCVYSKLAIIDKDKLRESDFFSAKK